VDGHAVKRVVIAIALFSAATTSWAADPDDGRWHHLPALEVAVTEAMKAGGGGTASVNGDAGLGCFELQLTAAAPATSLAEVQGALEDGLRARGAVVSIGEVPGRTRFRLGDLEGIAVTAIDPARKAARAVACLCRDRYPEQAMQTCQRVIESSAP
jgi:hypothetical protein